jgi:hypothetical protein
MAQKEQHKQDVRDVRQKAKVQLNTVGGLTTVSKMLAQQLQLPNLRYFGSEKEEDVERREEWLEAEEFTVARKDVKDKLTMLVELLESSDNVEASAAIQKEKIQTLKDKNLTEILKKSRTLEKSWRELDLFYTNAAQLELRDLTILNFDHQKNDEAIIVNKLGAMLDDVNKAAIDQSKSYSFVVAPGFIGESLIEKMSAIAYRNKVLFLTDYKDESSVDEVVEAANEPGRAKLGGLNKEWSRTVMYANSALLRDKYQQEKRKLYGSAAAAVAGKLYSIDNIAQPVAGAQFGPLKGLKGIRFRVSQDQANTLDRENFNPLTEAFGALMPFNCVTMFKGENVELRQYSVIRTLDYVDRIMKHFLNQYVFTSMRDSDIRLHVHRTILKMLQRLEELKILKTGRISHFEIDDDRPDRFNIKLEVIPMYVTSAFEYTIGIDSEENKLVEGEKNA